MAASGLQPGEYVITAKFAKTVLDIKDGNAFGHPYTMSPSQRWNVQTNDGRFWTIQNTLSKLYLGMRFGDKIRNNYVIHEVEHGFLWCLEGAEDHPRVTVPYTYYYLDIWEGQVRIYEHGNLLNTSWVFSKSPVPSLEDGALYSIINVASGAVVDLTDKTRACGVRPQSTNQHFQAVKTETGWAFKHINSDLYLGLGLTISTIASGTPVRGVAHVFSWMVLPASTFGDGIAAAKIFVAYTEKLMDLDASAGDVQDGTNVTLSENDDSTCKQWRFERVANDPPGGPILGEPLPLH
ncbi:hypothetical protein BKA70DRAFT_1307875 [Coprinopsis sp. MPI-PUGE-AT-0042]|nr:hypothetical protein BKA70DRAFT_1307875 [Coprinopsis sp. MPI-PUGE-AT-0042]